MAVYDGQIYIAGFTEGELPDQESYGGGDGFLRCHDSDGKHDRTLQFGSEGYDSVRAISARRGALSLAGQIFNGAMPRQHVSGFGDAFVIRAIID